MGLVSDAGIHADDHAVSGLEMVECEFERLGQPKLPMSRALDTLEVARSRFPGAQASLDALCRRFNIDNSAREKHGALLDSELLAEVYLELMGGRQQGLGLDPGISRRQRGPGTPAADSGGTYVPPPRPRPLPPRITEAERAAHEAFIAELGDKALWKTGA